MDCAELPDPLPLTVEQLQQLLASKQSQLEALRAQLENLTRQDGLTGVPNRSTLMEILETELLRSHRTGHPFCFAVLEFDGFDAFTAQFGSAAGDAVLKSTALIATKLLRALDRFGRLGPQEFGVLLPATWLDSAGIAMHRLRSALDVSEGSIISSEARMTFSAGLTTNAPGDTAASIVQRAQEALHIARADGGNRTATLEAGLPDMPSSDDDV